MSTVRGRDGGHTQNGGANGVIIADSRPAHSDDPNARDGFEGFSDSPLSQATFICAEHKVRISSHVLI